MKLTDFQVLTFDCYGTLIDWETGMIAALQGLVAQAGKALTQDQILEAHARHEVAQEAETPSLPYRELLSLVYQRLAEEWRVAPDAAAACAYGRSVQDWPAFADSAAALRYLKQHYKLVILSNVDRESFQASNRKLDIAFDAVYTAQDIGSYKPDLRNFHYMIEKLAEQGYGKQDILHTAESLFHDHLPANQVGLASAWIHRRAGKEGHGATYPPGKMPSCNFRFTSMAGMVEAHRKAVGERA